MFSYRLLHFPKKKNVAFLIGFFKPIFLFNFLAFPFIKFVLRLFFLFFILSFDLVSSLPFLPQLLAFLSLYISLKTVVISMLRQSTWRIDHLLHATLLVFFCLPAWSPVRIALPTCTCACVAISYWIVLEFCFHHPHT